MWRGTPSENVYSFAAPRLSAIHLCKLEQTRLTDARSLGIGPTASRIQERERLWIDGTEASVAG